MAKSSQIEQQKILRVFKLINLLQGNIGKPVHRLAELLETDERTIYRYFRLLEALGFVVIKEFNKYKINERPEYLPATTTYGSFSQEENLWLKSLIESQGKSNLLRDSLLQKLQLKSEVKQGTEQLFKANLGRFVDLIGQGISGKKQIWLKDYYSLSGDTVSDRLVEPVGFSRDYENIHAFEVESKRMKVFKIERIGEVVIGTQSWRYESKHELPGQALFGYTGKKKFHVKLKLSKKAYQLMGEEHPNAQPFMTIKNRNQFYFEGEIPQLPGLARFILGLPGEVKLEEGEEMRSYLKEQIGRGVF
ncbi:helix-turn-helix transcriptional regulator [Algoriphagus boritolerans]|uniref:Predicted DNA-binding transcriptional regulator YafY, contains an HTH and WYL domains n=2 Tax=Algoriphagus TaxID=246875 RepID=A0A1H6A7N6_9BACT|nr:WYL domain-containing protein [Algoriphagus boritolerans]SEG44382.1 Predicted DNA-binding transcriptional regulator YafY, contains an HTH and WYL domains [Algoriphagus boritolerans DSM 17298 = JCM 18970]